MENPVRFSFLFFQNKEFTLNFPFNFKLFLCHTYFILSSEGANNFDLFKSYLKNSNYVINFNQNNKFAEDCVVRGNKFEIILIVTILFVWNTVTNNERKKTRFNTQCPTVKLYTNRTGWYFHFFYSFTNP